MTPLGLARLSLVRFAASFVVVLTTGVLNRLFIADLGVAPVVGALILACQNLSSPFALWSGWLSDHAPIRGRRRAPYIVLFTALALAPLAVMPLAAPHLDSAWALLAAGAAFAITGFGLKAANLLVNALVVDLTSDAEARGRQVNLIWVMATVGFIVAGLTYGAVLSGVPSGAEAATSPTLWRVVGYSAAGVLLATLIGVLGLEARDGVPVASAAPRPWTAIRAALALPEVRATLLLLAVSDAGFFMQDLVLEPFGAEVFDLPLSLTTASFNVTFGAGMMLSMLASQGLGILLGTFPTGRLLVASAGVGAAALVGLAVSATLGSPAVPMVVVFVLGAAKGLYNTAIAHRFTRLASAGNAGVVMGAWGAVGGFAMALGGLLGGALVSLLGSLGAPLASSYAITFGVEAVVLLVAARLALRI